MVADIKRKTKGILITGKRGEEKHKVKCSICEVIVRDKAVNCEVCSVWFYITCENIPEEVYKFMVMKKQEKCCHGTAATVSMAVQIYTSS